VGPVPCSREKVHQGPGGGGVTSSSVVVGVEACGRWRSRDSFVAGRISSAAVAARLREDVHQRVFIQEVIREATLLERAHHVETCRPFPRDGPIIVKSARRLGGACSAPSTAQRPWDGRRERGEDHTNPGANSAIANEYLIARAMRLSASMLTLTSLACGRLPARSSRHRPRPRRCNRRPKFRGARSPWRACGASHDRPGSAWDPRSDGCAR
jgi:hypothetical protein